MEIGRTVPIMKIDKAKQIVLGVVYEPDVRDTDGNFMTAAEIEKMAYGFMEQLRGNRIDLEHNEYPTYGTVVESFIAREGDPDFPIGAWVLGTHITDAGTWEAVMKGEITGYSIMGRGTLIPDSDEE